MEVIQHSTLKQSYDEWFSKGYYSIDERWINNCVVPLLREHILWYFDNEVSEMPFNQQNVRKRNVITPPVDSVAVRHNLPLLFRQCKYMWDMIPWYKDNDCFVIEKVPGAEDVLRYYGYRDQIWWTNR